MSEHPGAGKTFGMASPRELLEKMRWELRGMNKMRAKAPEEPAYRAFNLAVTAWHMADWTWPALSQDQREELTERYGKGSNINPARPLQKHVVKEKREVEICRQLATGAKHFRVEYLPDPGVESKTTTTYSVYVRTGAEGRIIAVPGYSAVIMDGDQKHLAVNLFSGVIDYWDNLLKKDGL